VLQRGQIAVPGVGDASEFITYMAELERTQLVRYLKSLEIAHGGAEPAESP
jgi:hypothetical protein